MKHLNRRKLVMGICILLLVSMVAIRFYEFNREWDFKENSRQLWKEFYGKLVFKIDDNIYEIVIDKGGTFWKGKPYSMLEIENVELASIHIPSLLIKNGNEVGRIQFDPDIAIKGDQPYLLNDENFQLNMALYEILHKILEEENLPHPIVSRETISNENEFTVLNEQTKSGAYELYSNGKFFRVYMKCEDLDFSQDNIVFTITYERKLPDVPYPKDWYERN